jgi:hypothetical protein
MSPLTLLLGILIGMLIATPFTYIWTSRNRDNENTELVKRLAVAESKNQVFALEGYIKGQDSTLADFKFQQKLPIQTNEGILKKKFYVTLMERLEYRGIPLPWWETKIPVSEKLDAASLDAIAKVASVLSKLVAPQSLGPEIISTLLPIMPQKDSKVPQEKPNNMNSTELS